MPGSQRLKRLPPYVFNLVTEHKQAAQEAGRDFIEFGMGNPDHATPPHVVEALVKAVQCPENHRYSDSRGIFPLRESISDWYQRRYEVSINPETETLVTIGSKQALALTALAIVDDSDAVIVPTPSYPIHYHGHVLAGANVHNIELEPIADFPERLQTLLLAMERKPKLLVLNFPSNPTGRCADLDFLAAMVALAKQYQFFIVHDFAYADISFDGVKVPSILQVPGAKDVAVESYSLSKSYNMPGWRVGFMSGNKELISAISKMKSYTSYGMFAPIEIAAIAALEGPQECLTEICNRYQQRRDWLCDGLNRIGWQVEKPEASMFVWAEIPAVYQHMDSLDFCKYLIDHAGVAVAPGIGFGMAADKYVRFALIQDKAAIDRAIVGIQKMLVNDELELSVA